MWKEQLERFDISSVMSPSEFLPRDGWVTEVYILPLSCSKQ